MNYLTATILSIVEGLTEFLPVSSTFHLIQVAKYLSIEQTPLMKMYEVVIQAGAVCALFFLFTHQLWFAKRLYLKLLISTVPALIAGYLLHDYIKDVLFAGPLMTIVVFVLVGVAFLVVEWWVGRHSYRIDKGIMDINYRYALLIGLAQILALMPGVSRSGSVMVAMLLLNFRREEAATYSLALAVPTIFAASAYDLYKYIRVEGTTELVANFDVLVFGFIVAFVTAYFAARWFVRYLQGHTLRLFGIYRIIAGIILGIVSLQLVGIA